MKKLILIFTLLVCSLAFGQEDVPFKVFGVWKSVDNEFLRVYRDANGEALFQRVRNRVVKASGKIEIVDGEMHIKRSDNKDNYSLAFFIGETTMVITKPKSNQAWLWEKLD